MKGNKGGVRHLSKLATSVILYFVIEDTIVLVAFMYVMLEGLRQSVPTTTYYGSIVFYPS